MKQGVIVVTLIIAWAATFVWAWFEHKRQAEVVIETRVDTVRISTPELVVVHSLGSVRDRLPAVCDSTNNIPDTVEVEIPIEQAVYEDEQYRAYVRGYRPTLDSLILMQKTTTISLPSKRRQPVVGIGVQAGYGITPRGFQPYLGIGLSVSYTF